MVWTVFRWICRVSGCNCESSNVIKVEECYGLVELMFASLVGLYTMWHVLKKGVINCSETKELYLHCDIRLLRFVLHSAR